MFSFVNSAAQCFERSDDVDVVVKHNDVGFAIHVIIEGVVDASPPIANIACVFGQSRVFQDVAVPVELEDSLHMGEIDGVFRAAGTLDWLGDDCRNLLLRNAND